MNRKSRTKQTTSKPPQVAAACAEPFIVDLTPSVSASYDGAELILTQEGRNGVTLDAKAILALGCVMDDVLRVNKNLDWNTG